MKKHPKRIITVILLVALFATLVPIQGVLAASSDITFEGYVTYGTSTVGHFTLNGQQAFCLEHAKASPQTGVGNNGGSVYDDPRIITALYYGITGPKNIFGSDWTRGTVVTSLVLSAIYSGSSTHYTYTGFQELLALAEAGEYPKTAMSFSTSSPSAYVDDQVQRTENITFNADTSNQVSFSIPSAVTFYNVTTGATQIGGTVTVSGSNSFYLTAALDYSGTLSTGELSGTMQDWSAVLVLPDNSSYQDLGYGVWTESTAKASFSATFTTRTGCATIIKTSEDGIVAGLQFRITGNGIDETVTTGNDGTICTELLPGTYTVTEAAPNRYAQPESQTVTVSSGQTSSVSFSNVLKKFRVELTKADAETGAPQGDASLASAFYGLYKGDTLIETMITDSKGQAVSGYYVCDTDWTVREITPPEGYLLDDTIHTVSAAPGNFTIEHNSIAVDVTDQVRNGNIEIIKHTDDGSTQIETPEEGAVFEIYLKSSGSYAAAKKTERDTLTCDAKGYASSKDLPYGVYTIHQVGGWDGRELIADFDVYISKDFHTYSYLINNAAYASYIKIVKADAETGQTIAYAGAGFEIYDPDGNKVSMSYTYPTPTTVDVFYTNSDGYLVTPEKLDYGTGYKLVEVQAPYGYVLDSAPITFDVVQSNSSDEDGITVIKLTKTNVAQKGTITVSKTGEQLTGFTENEDGTHTPVYEDKALFGATYEITAAEGIYTQDGTLRAAAGDVVDTITTGDDGTATSCKLYLGSYTITETGAPYGMVLNSEPVTVELTYAGQEISVTETAASFYNERQKAALSLVKDAELAEGQTYNPYPDITFGLYSRGEITGAAGTVLLEADTLIEAVTLDNEGSGIIQTDLPFGTYYVRELTTGTGYLLDETEYDIVFDYSGQETDVVDIHVNEGEAIQNDLMRGSIKIVKTSEDGQIEGITFRVSGQTAVGTAYEEEFETDENGEISIDGLFVGEYTVTEVQNEKTLGYITPENQTVSLTHGAEETVYFENILMRGDLVIVKTAEALDGTIYVTNETPIVPNTDIGSIDTSTDAQETTEDGSGEEVEQPTPTDESTENETQSENTASDDESGTKGEDEPADLGLAGFEFRVHGTSIGGVEYDKTFTTDDSGRIEVTGLLVGEYTVTELESDRTVGYFFPSDQTVTVALNAVTTANVHNALIRGSLTVIKTDQDGNALNGAKFALYTQAEELVQEFTVDTDGQATIEGIAYGEYYIQELEAPEGYELDETKHAFSITEQAKTVEITVANQAIPTVTGDTPKTGDDRSMPYVALILSIAGFIGTGGLYIWKRRKEKNAQSETE